MSTRSTSAIALVASLALVPAAQARGGSVLLSGYAPSGAGEASVLSGTVVAPPAARTADPKLPLAAARGTIPTTSVTSVTGPATPAGGHAAKHGSKAPGRSSSTAERSQAADRAIVAAAARPAGSMLDGNDILIGALVAGVILGLAALWRRPRA